MAKKKNMKRKTQISIAVIMSLIAIAAVWTVMFINRQTNIIAFHNLSERDEAEIRKILQESLDGKKNKYEFMSFDGDELLSSQMNFIKKPALLITSSGTSELFAAEKAEDGGIITADILDGMTSSMRESTVFGGESGKSVVSVPMLVNFFGIEIDYTDFRNSGMEKIETWEDIVEFARRQKARGTEYPVAFAGKDPSTVLDLMGALTEALSRNGTADYEKAKSLLRVRSEEKFNAARIAQKLCDADDAPFYDAVKFLKSLKNDNLIPPNVFSLTKNDINAFIQARIVKVAFMSLDDHRATNQKSIARFSTIYFPSRTSPADRRFTANVIKAIPMANRSDVKEIISALVSTETQEKMSRQTGLAPVLARCRTPDKQASETRRWVAATNAPLPGLSKDCALTNAEQRQVVEEIAAKILYEK